MLKSGFASAVIGCALFSAVVAPVSADHSWGVYHWARTANPLPLIVVNSTVGWSGYVVNALDDWSASDKVDLTSVPGATGDKERRQCRAPQGQLRICNLSYGNNGWLGIAGISLDINGHIISGYTKLNDWYFSLSYYDTDDWRQSVTCQELGHNLGLDHQDEDFNNTSLGSCMDYQDPPSRSPNAHDYEQLDSIYAHLDSYNSYAAAGGGGGGGCSGRGCNRADVGQGDGNDRRSWGRSLGRRGQKEEFVRIDSNGVRHITFVTWAEGH